jgi:glycosyltransferase involved in cell wall biosynthesis
VFHGLNGGGLERSMLRLGAGLIARGLAVDVVVGQARGELLGEVPPGARLVQLDKARLWRAVAYGLASEPGAWKLLSQLKLKPLKRLFRRLPPLVDYFRRARPDAVFAAEPGYSAIAVWARRRSGLRSRVVVSERIQVSRYAPVRSPWGSPRQRPLLRRAYLEADAIVAVSDGVANDLATYAGIPRERIRTVYNPVVGPDLIARAREPLNHPWFAPGQPPVILGAGRLDPQKDFATLIRAFARVRARRAARLVILGADGPPELGYTADLKAMPGALGVAQDVAMPGFVENPYAFMARASNFVLSSTYEGLPGVLIQALACGCPVVSTDCPSGPREILDHGRFGPLVPVGDDAALARAIEQVLDNPLPSERLRARADLFSVDRAVHNSLDLLFPDHDEVSPPARTAKVKAIHADAADNGRSD